MKRSITLLVFVGLLLGSCWAEVIPNKHFKLRQEEKYQIAGFEGYDIYQGLRKLLQSTNFEEALLKEARAGDTTAVMRLLEAGADPDYVSSNGKVTPLILAAANDHADVVRILLGVGAEVGFRNNHGATALEFAAVLGSPEAVKALLAAGADPNELDDDGFNPIHRASVEGHTEVVQELVNAGGDINLEGKGTNSGRVPLHIAAVNGHLGLVKLLLSMGAEVDAEMPSSKMTPLLWAAVGNAASVTLALIEAGANVNHVDISGRSALFIAAYYGNQDAVEALVDNDADKTVTNKSGFTARDAMCQCVFESTVLKFCNTEGCTGSLKRMTSLLDP